MGERFYSRAKSAAMFAKVKETLADNARRRLEEAQRRQTDPFEKAKLTLQRRGFRVYSHSIHDPKSRLIVVGARLMTESQVIAHAERYHPRNPQGE